MSAVADRLMVGRRVMIESTDTALLLERSALLEAKGIPTYLEEVAHVGAVPQHLYGLPRPVAKSIFPIQI